MVYIKKNKKIPRHLGIILDGNRRWAEEKGLPTLQGHRQGLKRVNELIQSAQDRGIKILTLFVFSSENWKRAKKEVSYLMSLAQKALIQNFKRIHKKGIRIRVIGQRKNLLKGLQEKIKDVEKLSKNNKEMILNIALSYGGRMEIIEAIKKIIKEKIPIKQITEDKISKNLWTTDLDLIIRTGQEQRLSNFLIWQAAYSELYFLKKLWPDFTKNDLDKALKEYDKRQRRFGK